MIFPSRTYASSVLTGLAEARVVQLRVLVDEHRELLRKIQIDETEQGEVSVALDPGNYFCSRNIVNLSLLLWLILIYCD